VSGDLPRGAVTFVFTAVVGSTRLARELGARWVGVLERHRALILGPSHAAVAVRIGVHSGQAQLSGGVTVQAPSP
jgi:class 3 adenylate cyclase